MYNRHFIYCLTTVSASIGGIARWTYLEIDPMCLSWSKNVVIKIVVSGFRGRKFTPEACMKFTPEASERTFFREGRGLWDFQKTVGHFNFGGVIERTFSFEEEGVKICQKSKCPTEIICEYQIELELFQRFTVQSTHIRWMLSYTSSSACMNIRLRPHPRVTEWLFWEWASSMTSTVAYFGSL